VSDPQPDTVLPAHARVLALAAAAVGALLVVLFESGDLPRRSAAVFGALFAALGLGGLVDPRLLWSIGPRRRELPTWIRIAGALLAVAGLGVGVLLVLRAE